MRFLTARHLALAALVPALFALSVVPGCSNENEGERCGDDLGINNDDCSDGLVCIPSGMLLNNNGANRCCYPEMSQVHDSRCLPTSSTPGTGGSGGSGGSGPSAAGSPGVGGASTSDTASAGAADTASAGAADTASAGAADTGAGGN